MKVQDSPWLQENKPFFQKLLAELLKQFPYASLLAQDGQQAAYSVNRRLSNLSASGLFADRGCVVKVSDGAHWTEYSFNRTGEDLLPSILEEIKAAAAMSSQLMPEHTTEPEYPIPQEEETVFSGSTDYEVDPLSVGDDVVLGKLTALRDQVLAKDERILDCSVRISWTRLSKLFLSPKKDLTQNVLWAEGGLTVMASRGEEVKSAHESVSCLGGLELLDQLEGHADSVTRTALDLLQAEAITPGTYDCICTPAVTGMIVHEAFGHGVEMDMFVKKRALAEQYVGKPVASPLITMRDSASAAAQTGSYFFDDEGTMAKDTVIIKDGILQTGISDWQSAMVLGTEPTGNGRRQSFRRKAYTRMTNTWFEPGKDKLEDMIASIEHGYLLEQPSSGMEDPKNWGIQCMVDVAREIENGKLTGRIYNPIVLTGYVPDLLKSISMVSEETVLSGSGMCGKGWKEWVKVSDGGPYIKAKIRLG